MYTQWGLSQNLHPISPSRLCGTTNGRERLLLRASPTLPSPRLGDGPRTKCPHCGTPERARVKVCPSCGEAYAGQDLLEESQLAFLIKETAGWNVSQSLRAPYVERLVSLRARLQRLEPVPLEPALPERAADVIAPPRRACLSQSYS